MGSIGVWFAVVSLGVSATLVFGSVARVVGAAVVQVRTRHGLTGDKEWIEFLFCVDRQGIRILSMGAAASSAMAGWIVGGNAAGLIAGAAGWILPGAAIQSLRSRWRRSVEAELVSSFEGLAAGLRGGLSLLQALEQVSSESRGPLGRELRLVVREVKLGHSLEASLEVLADRVESAELDLAVAAIALARQQGGNLAERLGGMVLTLRERFRLEGKVRSLTAQARMQGRIVAAMPVCLGLVLWWMRPDLIDPMVRQPFGQGLLLVVALLDVAGLIWMGRLARVDV